MDWRCNAARAAISSRTSSGTPLMVICTGMNALCHQTQYSEPIEVAHKHGIFDLSGRYNINVVAKTGLFQPTPIE